MAGTMRPNEMDVSTTPTLSSGTLPNLASLQTDVSKKASAPRSPRVDVEPLYAAVKGSISDADWTVYKKTLSFFLLGNLNQEELSHKLSKILTTPALEHAHNALFTAIYANIWRDPPEAGIASWVSSSDKPTSGTVKGTGDESEKRLKHEVMQLSRRERKRLKGIPAGESPLSTGLEGLGTGAAGPVQEYVDARRAKQLDVGPSSNQGGGFGKTNWELEIRKRYTSALYVETHEFPTAMTIGYRLLPICYEFGLPQGHTPDCPDYLNIATETYIKEALANLLGKVSSNGPGYIRTGEFKKKLAREERLVERGELVKGSAGELPVEAEERRKRRLLCMEDLRLALEVGDSYLAQTPLIAGSIMNSRFLDTEGIDEIHDDSAKPLTNGAYTNGTNGAINGTKHQLNGETWTIDLGDPMQIDDEVGMHWQGGSVQDMQEMDDALDDILDLGDL
ncbi:transcriptional co-activator protein [Stemphylium lycopersici]|uniref:Transcriptional co-activator protein n=1 Tax=Stemphylium lycopersici TaxID=183478 RepID=A0A364MTQ1_STELY|nr:transcriptional co-activator protein [Stemphylium lycopersici]RAQ99083.1 transcriptional co-activator protein [Stemphylium lycopersici]RAR03119.1 transcriptional co-activator protein [Stemphylium lycopersici]